MYEQFVTVTVVVI